MFKKTLPLMAAPVGMQPGKYVPAAYADATAVLTPSITVSAERARGWRFELTWQCARTVTKVEALNSFVDACAVLSAANPQTPWITMGAPGLPVEGALWRADRPAPLLIRAEGLGSVVRGEPLAGWSAKPEWKAGTWKLVLELGAWAPLDKSGRFAVAVWQGADQQRAGLKSVTQDWVVVDAKRAP